MKPQAHIPTVSIGARDWRAATIAMASLFAAAMLLLALESGVLFNNPMLTRLAPPSISYSQDRVSDRVSLDLLLLSDSNDPARRFSVAHPLPANVTSSQLFSIALDSRTAFEIYGETAHSELIADERTVPEIQPRNDRLMLMLMLLRLHEHRD
jgi:hypothetical protein